MFQNFSGNSRRPRQVNLSGQNLDPFASTAWAPEATGTRTTLAAAQKEREKRQHERERLSAAKRIQRIWRGHRVRKSLAESRRDAYDELERQNTDAESGLSAEALAGQSQLLIAFYNNSVDQDRARLLRLAERLLKSNSVGRQHCQSTVSLNLARLGDVVLDALSSGNAVGPEVDNLLRLLSSIYTSSDRTEQDFTKYYTILGSYLKADSSISKSASLWMAISAPLVSTEAENGWRGNLAAYHGLAFAILTNSDLSPDEDILHGLASSIDVSILSQAVLQDKSTGVLSSMNSESRLWLLSHFIYFHNLRSKHNQEPTYIKALSTILSFSANDIFGRVEISRQSASDDADDVDGKNKLQPLPAFIRSQVISLVNKDSITSLLAKFDADYSNSQSGNAGDDASLLASYALTLLRTFPTLGEEIRMWLYQSSVSLSTKRQVPAVKLFWTIMKNTRIFSAISSDPAAALDILEKTSRRTTGDHHNTDELSQDRDWRAILLFLELYSFALRFTDDEEFLSGGRPNVDDPTGYMSRSRESSLALEDVKLLTAFLKNLSFTMYYNASDLLKTGFEEHASLSSLFGTTETRNFQSPSQSPTSKDDSETQKSTSEEFFGIDGMTFDYVRKITNRVMQMLYERDSRRRFLPRDHWLMTTRFDMEGFIPAVVAEEERRRQITDEEDPDGDDPMDEDDEPVMPMQRIGNRGNMGVSHARQVVSKKELRRRAAAKAAQMVGPRLEILQHMPYAIPFKTRVQIFRQFTHQDQVRRRLGNSDPDIWRIRNHGFNGDPLSRHHARIRRDRIMKDAFDQFYPLGEGLKEPIQITFVDKFGNVEAGIDGGGVTKEFLTTVTREAFTPENGDAFFVANDQNLIYPNPAIVDIRKRILKIAGVKEGSATWNETLSAMLKRYEFMGRVIGKCLYEGILVDISFAGFFLLKWALTANSASGAESRYQANLNDLRDLDEELYQGLLMLKNYPGDVSDFGSDFTIEDIISTPGEPVKTITRELLPNGKNISVTNENRVLYISLVARHKLHTQPRLQTNAFLKGLGDIIQPSWLAMFNQIELQTLIGGDMAEIDVDDLRANTHYSGVYTIGDDGMEHETVRYFWAVMKELEGRDKANVVKYVTSTPRAPLLGFSALHPKFTIRDNTNDDNRLPSASTCINLLKLPRYSSKKILKEKLLYAVRAGAGFDLS